jgi:RND family efflux transporter MFP subunit
VSNFREAAERFRFRESCQSTVRTTIFRGFLKAAPVLAAGFGALLSSSCAKTTVEASGPGASDIPTVAVVSASHENLSHSIVLAGEFKPYQDVEVMAKMAGYVKEIRVDVGDRVKEGDLLAVLEIPEMDDDLRRSQAAVKHSEAEVARARDEIQRAQSAHDLAHQYYRRLDAVAKKKPGLIAQQELDDAQSKDLVLEAQVASAKSALTAAQQQVDVDRTAVQRVQTMIGYQRVVAPFAGVVTKRYADKGSMIQAGTASQTQAMPVVRISQNRQLRLILPVPESAVPTVHVGQEVSVSVPALHRTFPGKVSRFANSLSLQTRTMDTEVDVPNADLVLIPGMYAEVNLTLQRHEGVVAVPVMAVDTGNDGAGSVMVVSRDNRVEVRRIEMGIETADWIETRSGLDAGDMVILSGRSALKAGDQVQPKLAPSTASAGY